jgi:transketolase
VGLGEALALRLQGSTGRVFVLSGDGELAEGSVWEAAAAASFHKVDNLFFIVDVNRLGQSDPTMYGSDLSLYAKRFEAFGWRVVLIEEGNNLEAVGKAWQEALAGKGPTVVLARTKKGAGISFLEDKDGWHGKALSQEDLVRALGELSDIDLTLVGKVIKPESSTASVKPAQTGVAFADYPQDKAVATRKAFGNALKRLGNDPRLVVLDADVKNSTYTEFFGKAFPERFVELFIAEQNMVGVAVGLSARGFHPVVSTFACFLTRASDQIRMAAFSGANILINGSHSGVSIGEDGPSQMGLEDLAQFRTVQGSTVLYPSDAISTERLVELALKKEGVVYMRTTRPDTAILYGPQESFELGGSKTFEAKGAAMVTVVGAGITLHEALKAQEMLAKDGIAIRVIDCYSIKPIDVASLQKAAKETKAIIIVEDHYPEGGLGEAVKSALADKPTVPIVHLAVYKTPRSGKSAELMDYEQISSGAIVKTVQDILSR